MGNRQLLGYSPVSEIHCSRKVFFGGDVLVKMFIALALAGLLASTAVATVSVQVYRADEQTPLEWADPNIPDVYRDIMVGTRLTFFVVSDVNEALWAGGIQVSWNDWDRGTLTGRGYNEISWNYDGSIFMSSGPRTYVQDAPNADAMHLSLNVDTALAGEWIVLDYYAQAVGTCNIGVYGSEPGELPLGYKPIFGDPPASQCVWIQALSFNHVPTRDFNGDCVVNFTDFALWAHQWHETIEADPNMGEVDPNLGAADPNVAIPGDLNTDDTVNVSDLALFCDFWLDRPDLPEPALEPDLPDDAL